MNQILLHNQISNQTAVIPVQVSVCIVSNRITPKLREIVEVIQSSVAEVLIGYDDSAGAIPKDITLPGNVRIVPMTWKGFSGTKNELAALAANPWILSLDSDELPDADMMEAISNMDLLSLPEQQIFSLKRISFFEGRKITHGAWGRDRVLRLYNRFYTQWDRAQVHEDLEQKPDTHILRLPGILLHYTADDYETFLAKNRNYARLSADKYLASGKKSPLWKRWLSPVFTFLKEYILQSGFLDGKAGLQIAKANALYTYWKYDDLKRRYQEG